MNPLAVSAFFDGRLGHEKQTKGILQALSGLTPTCVQSIRLPGPGFQTGFRNWRRFLWTRLFPVRSQRSTLPVDLIIGTGSYTHIPMLLHKEQCGARIVTCMTPDLIFRKKMDLCFVPWHDFPKPAGNVFVTLGPPNTASPRSRHDLHKGLILIGGLDPKSHRWNSAQTMAGIEQLIHAETGLAWTISSSPRTPLDMVQLLRDLAAHNPRVIFVESRETGEGWIEEAYATHSFVWVTADSISMIYEALTAGCRVGILPVQWKKKTNKFQKSIDYLIGDRRVITIDMWQAGRQLNAAAPLNEAARCAAEIIRRWWPERLPET